MKNSRDRSAGGGLFALLSRSYLAFTLVMLLIAVGVFELWSWRSDQLYNIPDVSGLLSQSALISGQYDKLSATRFLGANGALAVLDEGCHVLYCSSEDFRPDASLSPAELPCVQEYDSNTYVDFLTYTDDGGRQRYLLTEYSVGDDGNLEAKHVMTLDTDLNVMTGSFGWTSDKLTQRQFGLLTRALPENFDLYRASFTSENGEKLTLLTRSEKWTAETYAHLSSQANQVWFLLVPGLLSAAVFFILFLDHRLRRPLQRLDEAIVSLTEGKSERIGDCGGPREIRTMAENFDRMAEQLSRSESERKRLDADRQRLIADISHDLKTPITVISGYTRAIMDGKVPPEELPHYLEAIDTKAKTLTELINTFHEFSKVEHPQFSLDRKPADLCEYLREYLSSKYDEIELAGFTLEPSIPDSRILCSIDPFQLRRALDNIVSNTLKYNTLGTILYFSLRRDGGSVRLRIGDNGVGIPASQAESIFQPFTMGDESRSSGGSGLGLAITRRILEAHGGSIRLLVPPSPGRNTEFELTLPAL